MVSPLLPWAACSTSAFATELVNSSASLPSLLGGLSCSCPWAGTDRDRTQWGHPACLGWREAVAVPGRGCRSSWERAALTCQSWALVALHAGQAAGQTAALPRHRQCLAFFKRETCRIYVREWTWSSWSWRGLMNEMGSKILYTRYQGLTTPALSVFPCSCFPSLPLLHAQAPAVSVFSEQWHHLVCFLCQVYYRLSVRG